MAFEKEKQIKKWSRAKKEALIKGDYLALPNLANNLFSIHSKASLEHSN